MNSMNRFDRLLVISVLILAVTNIYVIAEWNLLENKLARLACSTVFALLFLTKASSKNLLLSGIFLLLVIGDVLLVNYEVPFYSKSFFTIHTLIYAFLIFQVRSEVIRPDFSAFQKIYLAGVFVLNSGLVILLGTTLSNEVEDSGITTFFYLHGFSAVLVVIAAILFYDSRMSKASAVFFFTILGLVLSDLALFPAYYLDFEGFYFFERILYILGLVCLIKFAEIYKKEEKEEESLLL